MAFPQWQARYSQPMAGLDMLPQESKALCCTPMLDLKVHLQGLKLRFHSPVCHHSLCSSGVALKIIPLKLFLIPQLILPIYP